MEHEKPGASAPVEMPVLAAGGPSGSASEPGVPAASGVPAAPSVPAAGGAPAHTRPRVVLIGPPGSGKTSTARTLSELTGVGWRDTDADVEETAGKPVSDIFLEDGEPAFRDLERAAVELALRNYDGILALGGGAPMNEATQRALTDYRAGGGVVVFLDVSLAHAAPRVGFNQSRPLLLGNPRARWKTLMDERRPTYEQVASVSVDTDDCTPRRVAEQILAHLGDGTWTQ